MVTDRPVSRRSLILGGVGALLALPALARAASAGRRLLHRFAAAPFVVPRTRRATRVRLEIRTVRTRMLAVAASPSLGLVLRFDGLHVARPPGVVWQVYLSPPGLGPKARKPYRFGNIALFGAGVGAAPPAAVELRNDAVVLRALRAASDELELTFVPAGPLIDGKPTTPTPAAALRVAKLTLWSETL